MMALLMPLALAMLWITWVAAAERFGTPVFSGVVPRNSAEAAGLGRASELLRFLREGDDPHRVYPVRPEILSSAILEVTTLEAAMWSRQLELIQLLDRAGVLTDPQERAALACLALDLKLDDIAEYLVPQNSGCDAGRALDKIAARTHDHSR
jgi:hypothetical protein